MKLYISDMDGMLLNSDKEIRSYTRDTINALMANGMCFSVASARTPASATGIIGDNNSDGVARFIAEKEKLFFER